MPINCSEIPPPVAGRSIETAFGCVRDFQGNQFVSLTISPRTGGLAVDVDLTPDRSCNLNCEYCDAASWRKAKAPILSVRVLEVELQKTLKLIDSGAIKNLPRYGGVPPELLELRQISVSGSGEPTLCPEFRDAMETIVYVRACQNRFFKMVLYTNGILLDTPGVQQGLQYFTANDEIWIKLDPGVDAFIRGIIPVEKLLANITTLGRSRPIVIQSLFPSINGQPLPEAEISRLIHRLGELKNAEACVDLVQLYSITPTRRAPAYGHLPLDTLKRIALRVRNETGLKVQYF